MKRLLLITAEPINETALLAQRKISSGMGAVLNFLGVVRGEEDSEAIAAINYEAFEKMVALQFYLLTTS